MYRCLFCLLLCCTIAATKASTGQRADSLEQAFLKEKQPYKKFLLLKELSALKDQQGATDSVSLSYYQELIRQGRARGDSVSVAQGLLYIGFHHYLNRRVISSTQNYHYALVSLRHTAGENLLKAQIYNCIGISYAQVGSYSTALHHYHKALAMVEKLHGWRDKADILDNIRSAFENLRIEDSLKYYSRLSLAVYEYLLNNNNDSSYYCIGIGKALISLNQPRKAIEYLKIALQIDTRKRYVLGIANAHKNLGACYQLLKNYQQAKYHYLTAISLHTHSYASIIRKLSDIAATENQYAKAYQYLHEYMQMMDTLRSIRTREQMFELEQLYRNIDKEREVLQAKHEAIQSKSLMNLFFGLFAFTLITLIFTGILYWYKRRAATQLSRLNQEISYINRHLDDLVKQRTVVIERQKQQIERFAFMNAHQIRGPVATMLGLVNIITQENLLSSHQELAEHLRATAVKMDAIVRQVQQTLDTEEWKNIDLPVQEPACQNPPLKA